MAEACWPVGSARPAWEEIQGLIDCRNEIIHAGTLATEEEARQAVNIMALVAMCRARGGESVRPAGAGGQAGRG